MGFANGIHQELALLFDPGILKARRDPLEDSDAPRFDDKFRIDLDLDATEDQVHFLKPPMELAVELVSGKKFRPIEAHLKSKALHGSETRAPKTPQQFQSQLLWQDASFTFGCDNLNRPLLIISLRLSFLSEHCAEWFIHERHLGFTVGIGCGQL